MEKASHSKAPVQAGQVVEVVIDSIAPGGDGVGRLEGYTIFVPFSAAGDRVSAEIFDRHKNYSRARIRKLIKPGPDRVPLPCPVAGDCGGCAWQHVAYPAQLATKQKFLTDALVRLGKIPDPPVKEIVPSPDPFHYRNKGVVPVATSAGPDSAPVFGFYAESSHRIVPLPADGCAIQTKESNLLLRRAFDLANANKINAYDPSTQEGILRNLMVRVNSRGQSLLVFITKGPSPSILKKIAEDLRREFKGLKGVLHNRQNSPGNVVLGEEIRLLSGEETLLEEIEGVKFRVSATSFFQVNTRQIPVLWRLLKEARSWRGNENILELYCGVGTLSLPLSKLVPTGSVWGVESSNRAVADAQENAALNNIANARFNSSQAVAGFAWMKDEGAAPDLLVVDPPRAGLEKEVTAAVLELKPPEIIYVSCDPATLSRDLGELVHKGGYVLKSVTPMDLFPQTAHVESVSYLSCV